jgi:glycosyltransferase involved in cell wall biosynthesis
MKNVLIIVHDFLPIGGGPVLHTLKVVKYLPQFGWKPIVLTVDPQRRTPVWLDPALVNELPEIAEIDRVPAPHKDYGYRWLPRGFAHARSIFRRERIDLIFTSSPPHNLHVLGWLLGKYFRRPWVADFRDGWTHSENFVARSGRRRWFDRVTERLIISEADHLLTATEPIAADLKIDYPGHSAKIHTHYNGFDPEDFETSTPAGASASTFNLVHVGWITSTPAYFFQAVRSLADRDRLFSEKCKIQLIGEVVPEHLDLIRRFDLTAMIELTGFVSHAVAVQGMQQAAALLLLINYPQQRQRERGMLTAKFCEYVGAGKPILAMTADSVATEFMRRYHLGVHVEPEDVPGIERALNGLFDHWQQHTLPVPDAPEVQELFNWRRTTQKLAALFDELAADK